MKLKVKVKSINEREFLFTEEGQTIDGFYYKFSIEYDIFWKEFNKYKHSLSTNKEHSNNVKSLVPKEEQEESFKQRCLRTLDYLAKKMVQEEVQAQLGYIETEYKPFPMLVYKKYTDEQLKDFVSSLSTVDIWNNPEKHQSQGLELWLRYCWGKAMKQNFYLWLNKNPNN